MSEIRRFLNVLTLDFSDVSNGAGASGAFGFVQDTDNDIRIQVAEPATLAVLGIGLVALGTVCRKRTVRPPGRP